MIGSTDVVLDRAAAHPEIAGLRAALRRRDWTACRALIGQLEPMARTGALLAGGAEPGIEQLLRGVLAANPADGAASALLGAHLIEAGRWDGQVLRGLREAELVLIEGAAFNRADPAIWTVRLITARGLEIGVAESRRRHDRALAAAPNHLPAQLECLRNAGVAGNDLAALLQFAREAVAAVPPGSPHGVLIAHAHIEYVLRAGAAGHLARPEVRAEIHDAAGRSIWHPDFRRGYGWVEALNGFALLFTMLDDRRSAATAFAALGNQAAGYPWSLMGDDVEEQIRSARAWAFEVTR